MGFLSSKNNDFIFLNKEGINLVRLDKKIPRKAFRDNVDTKRMVHSLASMNYLKVEDGNMLHFDHDDSDQSTLLRV